MRAWITKSFGQLLVKETVPDAKIWANDQVLIKVKASSVNPIDVRMTEGYGNELLSQWRRFELNNWNLKNAFNASKYNRLPLINGRDCSGEIVEVGSSVTNFSVGDEVFGVIPAHWPGSHAEYVVAPINGIVIKAKTISHVDACAFAYTMCTAWQALINSARIDVNNCGKLRVLIHGGSGGMGTTSIQLLRALGIPKIVATCSKKNMDLVQKLGAISIDYNSLNVKDEIIANGPYEVIMDCLDSDLSEWSDKIMGVWRNAVHVSLISPIIKDTDRYGIPAGLTTSFIKYALRSIKPALQGRWFTYAFFKPDSKSLSLLMQLINEKKIVPIIEKVYSFDETPIAYDHVKQLHSRGKSVIDLTL